MSRRTKETEREAHAGSATRSLGLVVSCASGVHTIGLTPGCDIVLGRSTRCDVVVDDPSVSRRHAKLRISADCALEDLGSSNGTSLGGVRLRPRERIPLPIGAAFGLGSAVLVIQSAPALWWSAHAVRSDPARAHSATGPVVCDAASRSIYALLDVVARTNLTVLVLGETGVGKEAYVEALHYRSARASAPLVRINCAALPDSTLEAELFGYERGAFTGATQTKPGLIESADGGTLLLDEIGEMPMAAQARLLRVLDSGEVLRLGSVKPRRVDVRFVAATNRDPKVAIAEGRLREDILYRLTGFRVTIPPLRARRADIGPLARLFLSRAPGGQDELTPAAIEAIESYDWPGNVRELKHIIERTAAFCAGTAVDVADLVAAAPEAFGVESFSPSTSPTAPAVHARAIHDSSPGMLKELRGTVKELERQRVAAALTKCGGNQSAAARLLGVSRSTLIHRMKEFGLARTRWGGG